MDSSQVSARTSGCMVLPRGMIVGSDDFDRNPKLDT